MLTRESVRELIGAYSAENFAKTIKAACAPATFVSVDHRILAVGKDLPRVTILGVVKDLGGENGLPAPLLVADVPMGEKTLTERSSRIAQFKVARQVLEQVCLNPPVAVDGIIVQGVFAFHDAGGRFRVSLVTAKAQDGKLVWSQVRRQSFFVTPEPERNATFIQRMTMNWSSLAAIKEAFSVEKLTKEFYTHLFQWYQRACEDERVEYPNDLSTDNDNREDKNRKHLLRLITRLMFVWFLKQKGLVPAKLFDEKKLKGILKNFNPVGKNQHQYYRAILQNLFFATLNSEIDEREFAETPTPNRKGEKATTKHHGVKTKYRYADAFSISRKEVVELFKPIPFLNGGLFECLDQEGGDGKVMYYDGFSLQEHHRDKGTLTWAHVPNDLFFDPEYGIIPLLKRYNFTVEENTPGDEDVALDPELLGKVFENLLGAYNPETEQVVRNSTGSFYTPREIVNYMVDESLIACLEGKVDGGRARTPAAPPDGRAVAPRPPSTIRALVKDGIRPADSALCKTLIAAIEGAKILDPACGSGAFPMGALLKMAELLRILKKLPEDANLYELKLKLIENCIFGVDIQEIAVQISKLRIFISLVCEQKPDWDAPNYGINTLPNLETKFVAANSLIGLKRTDAKDGDKTLEQLVLFDTAEIEQLKTDLWKKRDEHFRAKTRKDKNRLRKEDKALREKLAKRGNELGYSTEATRLMASWDPYNQNVHSDFFDPAWMFNVKDGFDIVVGNPPYGIINKKQGKSVAIVVTEDVLAYYKRAEEYKESRGKGSLNIYRLFVQRSISLLGDGGIFNEIFPLAYAGDLSAAMLRAWVFNKCEVVSFDAFPERDDPNKRVFEAAKMSVCVLCARKKNAATGYTFSVHGDRNTFELDPKVRISLDMSQGIDPIYHRMPIASQIEYGIIDKVRRESVFVKDKYSCSTGELDISLKKDVFTNDATKPEALRGAGVLRYALPTSMSQGERLYVDERKLSCKDKNLRKLNRIVFQGMTGVNEKTRLKAMLVKDVYCANSVNYIVANDGDEFYLLGLINSKLMNFIFSKFSTNSNVNGYEVDVLPLPKLETFKDNISRLAEHIVSLRCHDECADITDSDAQIDELVYDLYGLTKEEREIVDGKSKAKVEGEGGAGGSRGARTLPANGGRGERPARPQSVSNENAMDGDCGHAGRVTLPAGGPTSVSATTGTDATERVPPKKKVKAPMFEEEF